MASKTFLLHETNNSTVLEAPFDGIAAMITHGDLYEGNLTDENGVELVAHVKPLGNGSYAASVTADETSIDQVVAYFQAQLSPAFRSSSGL